MDRGAWRAIVHGVPKSQTQLKQLSACTRMHTHIHTQEGTEPQRIHRVTVDFMSFSNIFKCQCQILGTASLERFLKSFFFFSVREQLTELEMQDSTDRKWLLFFLYSWRMENPTPLLLKICKQMWLFHHIYTCCPHSSLRWLLTSSLFPSRTEALSVSCMKSLLHNEFSVIYFLNSWFQPHTCIKMQNRKAVISILQWIYLNIGGQAIGRFCSDYQHC